MKIRTILLTFLILQVCFLSSATADDEHVWLYSIKNGMEYTNRSYLLVYSPGTKEEKTITVGSRCNKPYPSERAYGECLHTINIRPDNKRFILKTGEDVVIVDSSFESIVLGTIEYGCCGASDTVNFYTQDGEHLGKLNKANIEKGKNTITDAVDLGNSAGRHKKINYFIVQEDNDKYSAWVREVSYDGKTGHQSIG